MTKATQTVSRPGSTCFQGVTAALRRLNSYKLELRSPMVRVRAKGTEMVWRADTDKGPRWLSYVNGKWIISKVPPRKPEEPRAA